MPGNTHGKKILWWGRFDPAYSRNSLLRALLADAGHRLVDFRPRSSLTGTIEAAFARLPEVDAVWVPAFRQRDFHSARKFADRRRIPLIFDPLISAWDKAVFERCKYPRDSRRAARLLDWERSLFRRSDVVIADTGPHADFFIETMSAPRRSTFVIPVGAEEDLFVRQPWHPPNRPVELLFFGSFINLQGPEIIVEAAAQVPEATWTMLGDGPLRGSCEEKAGKLANVRFERWQPYEALPGRIGSADILLGIFGTSAKAGRVIPNKVYQALACGRPLITRSSPAYPAVLGDSQQDGICFVPPGDPLALANRVRQLLSQTERLEQMAEGARRSFETFFSATQISRALTRVVKAIS